MASPKRPRPVPKLALFVWDNPPGPRQGGFVTRTLQGRRYSRRVGPNDLLDIHEAAAALGNLHPYSVYRLIWERRLPTVRRRRSVLISLRAIKHYRRQTPRSRAVRGSVWLSG